MIIYNEVLKILRIKTIIIALIITLFTGFIYYIYLSEVDSYKIGVRHVSKSDYMELSCLKDYVEKYGTKIEHEKFKERYTGLKAETEKFFVNNPVYAEHGIKSYEEFEEFILNYKMSKDYELYSYSNKSEENIQLYEETLKKKELYILAYGKDYMQDDYKRFLKPGLFDLTEVYSYYQNEIKYDYIFDGLKDRWTEYYPVSISFFENFDKDKYETILPAMVFRDYVIKLNTLSLALVVFIVFIILPSGMRDSNIISLQYTTKHGRYLFLKKYFATVIVTNFMYFIMVITLFILCSGKYLAYFFRSYLNSYFMDINAIYWREMTFLQYIFSTLTIVYIISLGFATLTYVISRKVKRNATYAVVSIPIIAAAIFFIRCNILYIGVMDDSNQFTNDQTFIANFTKLRSQHFELIFSLIFLICCALICLVMSMNEQKRDIQYE